MNQWFGARRRLFWGGVIWEWGSPHCLLLLVCFPCRGVVFLKKNRLVTDHEGSALGKQRRLKSRTFDLAWCDMVCRRVLFERVDLCVRAWKFLPRLVLLCVFFP